MIIDAHVHLDRYGDLLESALKDIEQHGVFAVSNSMDLPSYERNLEIGRRCELVLPIFGVHPWNAPAYAGRLDDLSEAVEQSPMLGEIGLDYFFVEDASEYPAQREVFEFFLAAAREQDKIVNVHTKGAEEDVLRLLERHDAFERTIVHWYSGPLDIFREMAARGASFTIGVEVMYSEHIQVIARELPSQQLLTETDNPGGPKGFIGELGKPALIKDVIQALAELRGTTADAIVRTVQDNFLGLIEEDPRFEVARATICEG